MAACQIGSRHVARAGGLAGGSAGAMGIVRGSARQVASLGDALRRLGLLGGCAKPQAASRQEPVRLLTRMDEDEELPMRRSTFDPAVDARDPPRPGGGVFGPHVPLYIGRSSLLSEGGRGVFPGCAVARGAVVEVCPVIAVARDHVATECAGLQYFFGGPDGSTLLCVLGWGMMYNHGRGRESGIGGERDANLVFSLRQAPPGLQDARDAGVCVRFEASRDIAAGEELLIDYSDRWWQSKGIVPE